jgi:hypothetical protein
MRGTLRSGLVVAFVALVALPLATARCVPPDYLGGDPSAASVVTNDGGDAAPAPSPTVPASPPVDAAPACQPPEGRLPYVSAAPRDPVCAASEVNALAECLADAEREAELLPLSRCFTRGLLSEACQKCALTPASAPLWGPLVVYEQGIVRPNVGGCVERTVPGAAACAAPAGALEQCVQVRVCGCSRLASCRVEASNGTCAEERVALESCLVGPFAASPGAREAYQNCGPKADATYWRRQISIFCGP